MKLAPCVAAETNAHVEITDMLKLILKKKWYDMIARGEKLEEYREIKPYYLHRLLEDYWGNKIDEKFINDLHFYAKFKRELECMAAEPSNLDIYRYKHKDVMFFHGYAPTRPFMTFAIKSITIGEGKPEWGAEPGKEYFIIKFAIRKK